MVLFFKATSEETEKKRNQWLDVKNSVSISLTKLDNHIFHFKMIAGRYVSCIEFSSVQLFSCSVMSNSLQPHELQHSRPPCPSRSLPKPMSIELVMPSNHLILCRPLLLLPSVFPNIRVFQMRQLFLSGSQNIGVSALNQSFQ